MKTYWKEDKFITEKGNKRTIKDYTYHFFPDFFKPTMFEYGLFIFEFYPSLAIGHIGNYVSKGNIFITIGSGFIPQILAYSFFRGVELYSMINKKGKRLLGSRITDLKKRFPYKPKITIETIDDVVEEKT